MNPERDPSIGVPDPETEKQKKVEMLKQQIFNEGLSAEQKEKLIKELQEIENLEDSH